MYTSLARTIAESDIRRKDSSLGPPTVCVRISNGLVFNGTRVPGSVDPTAPTGSQNGTTSTRNMLRSY